MHPTPIGFRSRRYLSGCLTVCLILLRLDVPAFATPLAMQTCTLQPHVFDVEIPHLFEHRQLTGAMVMQTSRGETTLAAWHENSVILPLSTIKLFLFASYLEHRAELPASVRVDPLELIAQGSDFAGRTLALQLRHALGSAALLRDLESFGLPRCAPTRRTNCTTLVATTTDVEWANAMSLGETHFRVTPLGLSHFLQGVSHSGISAHGKRIMHAETALAMRAAMIDTMQVGTARGLRNALGSSGRIGGKTGTGPAAARPYDGIFAGLVFDAESAPRFTIVTYARAGGLGGGAAAELSAELARESLTHVCDG